MLDTISRFSDSLRNEIDDVVLFGMGGASLAPERKFGAVFSAEPSIGGRYSALSPFGIVPAVLMGIDAAALLERAQQMRDACRSGDANPGYELGQAFGEGWNEGRDKICIAD